MIFLLNDLLVLFRAVLAIATPRLLRKKRCFNLYADAAVFLFNLLFPSFPLDRSYSVRLIAI